jgi:hypothetical protein
MAFDNATRAKALVAAARHCCVCHRYKGVKVEVHHVVPEAEGGDDTLENAITLCFDCHADAGHYNTRHPRGSRFSQNELRRARSTWHATVLRGSLSAPPEEDMLYCRYLLCQSFNALKEIVNGDLQHLPVQKPLLVRNDVLGFLAALVQRHPRSYRQDFEWGDSFPGKEDYSRVHPAVAVVQRSSLNTYPYFQALRTPRRSELQERIAPYDSVTALLLRARAPLPEIALALAYTEICGLDRFQEIYRLRPLWAVFLAASNVTQGVLHPDAIRTMVERVRGSGFRGFFERRGVGRCAHRLPGAPLPPGATIVFPVATLLGPLCPVDTSALHEQAHDISTGEFQTVAHCDLGNHTENVHKIGPAAWPAEMTLNMGTAIPQQIHDFNLGNLYLINRSWRCGSCPHVLLRQSGSSRLTYVGQLFGKAAGLLQREAFVVPEGVDQVVVAELEHETTRLASAIRNAEWLAREVTLQTGDTLRICVTAGDEVEFEGFYCNNEGQPLRDSDPWSRNLVVFKYLNRAT